MTKADVIKYIQCCVQAGVDFSTLPEYDSDTDAAAAGLISGQAYKLTDSNDYGMKAGTVIILA